MTHRHVSRLFRACVAIALIAASTSTPALAFDLPGLMTQLAQRRSGEATFTEQRFIKGLDRPLSASGVLAFSAPDRFVRRTLKPRPESMTVEGNTITLTRGSRSRRFTLDAAPEMVAVVEAFRGTLTGNEQTLQRFFAPALTGTADEWVLDLVPVDAALAQRVRRIRIGGSGADMNRIEIELADGDRSVMTIQPAP